MKININAVLESKDIVDYFTTKLSESGIDPKSGKIVFSVQNKANEWVNVEADKVKVTFNN